MSQPTRSVLALIEGFRRPRAAGAHGTQQAAYATCEAIARHGGYRELHLYKDSQQPAQGDLVLPQNVPTKTFERLRLRTTQEKYQAIYVANGQQIVSAPHLLRPRNDWAPVVCSVGTAHSNGQWSNLLLALASGAIRDTDGFIFKSAAAQGLFRTVCDEWTSRFRLPSRFPPVSTVIPNGVDVVANRRSEALGDEMRRQLRLDKDDVVFLSFSRLSPGTKGDFQALVVRWREVRERFPRAILLLSGSNVDKAFVADLRQLVRAAGVGDGVLILDDPFDLAADARTRLMSAADVFIHLSTGVEEASSLVVSEAMAHSLPLIMTAWAGLPELVTGGEEGFLVPTLAAPLPTYVTETLFGQAERTHTLFAGKVVALDWTAFTRGVLSMADPHVIARMGAAARRRAESHDLATLATRYVDFFASTSVRAAQHSRKDDPFRPLVSLDAVTAAQASSALKPDQLVRVGDRGRLRLVLAGLHPEARPAAESILDVLSGREPAAIAELAEASVPQQLRGSGATCLAERSRLLVRLLNFGVIELVLGD